MTRCDFQSKGTRTFARNCLAMGSICWFRFTFAIVCGVFLASCMTGCGAKSGIETAPVSGIVTLDGKPLHKGTISFLPDRGRTAIGEINPDGTFTLSTYGNGDGAIVGHHRISIMAYEGELGETGVPKWIVPQHYTNPAESALTFDVTADGKNEPKFELSSSTPAK